MTDIVERLREVAAMDLRVGPIPAHTLDTAKEAADEIERLRAALQAVVNWADDLGYYAEAGTVLAPVFQVAKAALEPR